MRYFFFLALSLLLEYAGAQDMHFSQFLFAPQLLSPAEAGQFAGRYRINANQKTQWREVSRPYSTFAAMADGRLGFLPAQMAGSVLVVNDNAGDGRFNTFGVLVGTSYSIKVGSEEAQTLTGGLQVGISHMQVDFSRLSFNNQYNGVVYDPSLPTGERWIGRPRWYFNSNLGLRYHRQFTEHQRLLVGVALHNVLAPGQSFYTDTGVRLPQRFSIYASGELPITDKLRARPALRYMRQATFEEFIIGGMAEYQLIAERDLQRSVRVGYFGRAGDSGIVMLALGLDAWQFGLSYDINVSDLEAASRNRGGLELSLQYIFQAASPRTFPRHIYCPVYL